MRADLAHAELVEELPKNNWMKLVTLEAESSSPPSAFPTSDNSDALRDKEATDADLRSHQPSARPGGASSTKSGPVAEASGDASTMEGEQKRKKKKKKKGKKNTEDEVLPFEEQQGAEEAEVACDEVGDEGSAAIDTGSQGNAVQSTSECDQDAFCVVGK